MMTTSRVLTVVGLLGIASYLTGCGAPPDGQESTGATSQAVSNPVAFPAANSVVCSPGDTSCEFYDYGWGMTGPGITCSDDFGFVAYQPSPFRFRSGDAGPGLEQVVSVYTYALCEDTSQLRTLVAESAAAPWSMSSETTLSISSTPAPAGYVYVSFVLVETGDDTTGNGCTSGCTGVKPPPPGSPTGAASAY